MVVQGNAPATKEGRRDGCKLQEPVIQVREKEKKKKKQKKEQERKQKKERLASWRCKRDVEGGKKMKPEVAQANRSGANGQSFNEG